MNFTSLNYVDGEIKTAKNKPVHKIPSSFEFGQAIGKYLDVNIYDQVTDNHGVIRYYAGVTKNCSDCKSGSVILQPGIIYEPAENTPAVA